MTDSPDDNADMLPQSVEAEMGVLGSMVLDPRCIHSVAVLLEPEDFHGYDNRLIYTALIDTYEQDKPIDLILLRDELKRRGQLAEVGGVDYLMALGDSVPSPANAAYYAGIVRKTSFARKVITEAERLRQAAYNPQIDTDELQSIVEQQVLPLAERTENRGYVPISDVTQQAITDRMYPEQTERLSTGFVALDDLLGKLKAGEIVVIAGRPSMGKTAFALQILHHAAAAGTPTALFSLEMTAQAIADRLLAAQRGDVMTTGQWEALKSELDKLPLWIEDAETLTPLQMRLTARQMVRRHGIKLLAVDYLQLLHVPRPESRQQEVALIARALKSMAKEFRVPILALAQLNRQLEGRADHLPRLSDLRESGEIEQVADVVILLHREDYYHSESTYIPTNRANVIVAKHRNGATGKAELMWLAEKMLFGNLAKEAHE